MKIDRLLEIIIFLVNHPQVTAHSLASHFNVSVRTIQRDMVTLSSIGIPVYSLGGKYGGYAILPEYKMKNTHLKNDEQQLIIKALESLSTTYSNDTLSSLLEKYNAIVEKEGGQKVFWDFSVTKENSEVQSHNSLLEKAITQKHLVTFNYRSSSGKKTHPTIEPLALHYKWYAWYLFAYSMDHQDYRTYKVARIQNLTELQETSNLDHGDISMLMQKSESEYYTTCLQIEIHFKETEIDLMKEYFPDCPIEKIGDNLFRMFIHVPQNERLWKALLLSFGDKVKVISPEGYKDELIHTARQFLSQYTD